ncbi:MAG: hypothetical protein CVV28_02165 [Methanobacteriales archaeon HGW-Methanobacteriales-1]|jgi:hypothetical protein|nr:MAG: hypothetical protein CVV28_02165 [Methanobacteriales archaeon HGW-Methanobacteriales-1]
MDSWKCPNKECEWSGEGEKGKFCPKCGSPLKNTEKIESEIKVRNLIKKDNSTKKMENGPAKIIFREDHILIKRKNMLRKEFDPLTIYYHDIHNFKFIKKTFTKLPQIKFETLTDNYTLVFRHDKEIKQKIEEYSLELIDNNQMTPVQEEKVPKLLKDLPITNNPRLVAVLRESTPGRLKTTNNKNDMWGIAELGDEELIIYKKSMLRKKDRGVKHLRYDQINSVDYDTPKTLAAGAIQLYLSSVEYSLMSRDPSLEPFYHMIREKMAQKSAPETSHVVVESSQPSYINELKELAELKDSGIVTEEEFELKKKELLGL